jgi:hypothetical protein
MLEAGTGEAEMVEPVIEMHTGGGHGPFRDAGLAKDGVTVRRVSSAPRLGMRFPKLRRTQCQTASRASFGDRPRGGRTGASSSDGRRARRWLSSETIKQGAL